MFRILLLLLALGTAASQARALSKQELATLTESIKEMCVAPDRMGEYIKAEGVTNVGLPVTIRIVKGEIGGKLTYESWKGIPITLDKYKMDPRQCAVEVLKILLHAFPKT